MKKTSLYLFAAGCTALASLTCASAQTQASSKPMGYVTYTAKGNSDTRIGAPVHRKAAFVGKVDSVVNGNEITVQGAPGWSADEFTDATNATPPASELYFVLIASGNMEGRHFEVTGNDADTLTIDLAGETITTDVINGTALKLIPYWTLDTLFPAGAGVHSSTLAEQRSQILTQSTMSAGVNLSNTATYYYYDGSQAPFTTAQWLKVGESPFTSYGTQPLAPDVQLIVRHNIAIDTEIVPIGDVFTTSYRTLVNILATGVDQDNSVFLNVPIDVSLGDSNLFQSGAFAGNTSLSATASDTLLVFDNAVVAQNKSLSQTFYYYTDPGNTFGGAGWRLAGDSPFTVHDADIVFSLDKQVIIRKKGATAGSQIWSMTPSYLPFP